MASADRWTAITPGGHPDGYLDAFRNVIAESWRGMREGGDAFPTFAAGARGIATVEAAIRSARPPPEDGRSGALMKRPPRLWRWELAHPTG
jgi:hypothetical protein